MPHSSSKGNSSSKGSSSKGSSGKGSSSTKGTITTTITSPGSPRLLFDLPESLQAVIARFLRVKQALLLTSTCTRLHLPPSSQIWYVSDELRVNWRPGYHGSTFLGLLRRLPGVTTFDAGYDQIIYPLAMASTLGLCKNLCEVDIGGQSFMVEGGRVMAEVSVHALDCLGMAIGAGSMPALQSLRITTEFEKGGVQALLRGLWNGASPNLHKLDIPLTKSDEIGGSDAEEGDYYRDYEINMKETRKNVIELAVMLDKRRRLGCCVGLKVLPDGWMEFGSASATMRILRSVLGTLEALNFNDQKLDDANCARLVDVLENEEVLVPQMKRVGFYGAFGGLGGATRVFHAMGKTTAFKSVHRLAISEDDLTTEALHALMSTLKSDALPSLEILSLKSTPIATDDLPALLEALEQSACAHTLRELDLSKCGICAEGAKVLGLALERNFLSSLEKLDLSSNKLGNDGVSFLTQSLQASSLTKLTDVELKYVGMDDVGRKSLAEAIKSGALGKTRIWS